MSWKQPNGLPVTDEPPEEPPLHPEAAFALQVTRRQWRPLAVVLVLAAISLALVLVNFRLGALSLAAAVAVAFFLRLLLSEEAVGILAVRARYLDLAVLGLLTVGLTVLAVWVPLI